MNRKFPNPTFSKIPPRPSFLEWLGGAEEEEVIRNHTTSPRPTPTTNSGMAR